MKTVLFISLTLVLCLGTMALSDVYAYDSFGYDTGVIIGQAPPTLGFSGAWMTGGGTPTQCTVESASLIWPGADSAYQNSSGSMQVIIPTWDGSRAGRFLNTDPNGPFADYVNNNGNIGKAGQTLYISFLMKTNYTSPFYAFELKRDDLGDGGAILYVGNDIGGNNLQVCAFRDRNQDASNIGRHLNWLGTASTDTELFVIRIDFGQETDQVTVHRNPALDTEPEKSPDLVNPGYLDFDGISMAVWVDPAGRAAQFDEVCVATTYADAVRFYNYAERAQHPTPADGAVDIASESGVTLSWDAGTGINPTGYNVYCSKVLDDVIAGASTAYLGDTTDTSMTAGSMDSDSIYYWSVTETTEPNDIPGVIWMFETNKTLPTIVREPSDQHVFAGESATFTFDAASVTPAEYQWFDASGPLADSETISGTQTDTLVVVNAQLANQNTYYCEVTNSVGTITTRSAELLIKRLVGYWPLDQYTGSDPNLAWADASGSNNHLEPTYTAPATFDYAVGVDGTADGALVFDGGFALGTMKADGTMNDIPAGDYPFSMTVWFKTATVNGDRGLLGWGNYGTRNACNALTLNNNLTWLRNYWWDADVSATRHINLRDDNWHQVVVTYDGDIRKIYIDGLEASTDNPAPHAVQTNENFLIGKTNTTNATAEFYIGALDEVKVHNYALAAVDVAAEYTGLMGGDLCLAKPVYDLDNDCDVDLADLSALISEWLNCGLYPSCLE